MSESEPSYPSVLDLKNLDQSQSATFTSLLLIRQVRRRTAKNGNEYLAVELGDKTGNFQFICFNDSPPYEFFASTESGAVVKVEGRTEYYQERFSPRIHAVNLVSEERIASENLLERLLSSALESAQSLWEELLGYVNDITDESLRHTVNQVLSETEEKFRTVPAAISMHHAYRGGLLEHTVHLCRTCRALLPLYPEVDADLAMSGIIVHDIGKTLEYSGDLAAKRSRAGILHGHVVLGYRLVRKAALKAKLNLQQRERLEHIVLSHQGEIEWGAATMAATPEAIFVSMLDNLDAKMGMVQHALRTTPEGDELSEYLPGLKTQLLTRPIRREEEETAPSVPNS